MPSWKFSATANADRAIKLPTAAPGEFVQSLALQIGEVPRKTAFAAAIGYCRACPADPTRPTTPPGA